MRILRGTVVAGVAALVLGACSSAEVTEAPGGPATSASGSAASTTQDDQPVQEPSTQAGSSSASSSTTSESSPSSTSRRAGPAPSKKDLCDAVDKYGKQIFGKEMEAVSDTSSGPVECERQVKDDPTRRLILTAAAQPIEALISRAESNPRQAPNLRDAKGGPPGAKFWGDDENKPSGSKPGQPKYPLAIMFGDKEFASSWMFIMGDDKPSVLESKLVAAANALYDDPPR